MESWAEDEDEPPAATIIKTKPKIISILQVLLKQDLAPIELPIILFSSQFLINYFSQKNL